MNNANFYFRNVCVFFGLFWPRPCPYNYIYIICPNSFRIPPTKQDLTRKVMRKRFRYGANTNTQILIYKHTNTQVRGKRWEGQRLVLRWVQLGRWRVVDCWEAEYKQGDIMPFRALPRTLWHRTRWDRYKYTNMNRQIQILKYTEYKWGDIM